MVKDISSTRKRRWFQFSLRGLLAAITIFGVWLGWKLNAAHRQREAVLAILKAGGTVSYDYQMERSPIYPDDFSVHWDTRSPTPQWLQRLVGDDFFHDVIEAKLEGHAIPQSDFEKLAYLPRLWHLSLNETKIVPDQPGSVRQIQDSDLVVLAQLSQMRLLELRKTGVNGSGLSSLTNMKHLNILDLAHTQLDDDGMKQIGKLTGVQKFDVGFTQITDVGLKCLQGVDHPKECSIRADHTHITNDGISKAMTNLPADFSILGP